MNPNNDKYPEAEKPPPLEEPARSSSKEAAKKQSSAPNSKMSALDRLKQV